MKIVTVPGRARTAAEAQVAESTPRPVDRWEEQPLRQVRVHEIERRGQIELQHVEIAAGGHFVMHASDRLAFCHVVHGAGVLGLADGSGIDYLGPTTFVFHPGALHEWRDVVEDTLLAVAIVPDQA